MVARNEKSMMKLIRLPILTLLLLQSEILKDLYDWVAKLATQPYKSFHMHNFSY